MDIFLIKATQLIVALALLVIIHEFGHFVFARIFGIRVEKFYIFFNPLSALVRWRPGRYIGILKKSKKLAKADSIEACDTELRKKEEAEAEQAYNEALNEINSHAEAKHKTLSESKLKEEAEKLAAKKLAKSPYRRSRGFWTDTEYGLGWIPLGGYCKISGMIDESMDTEQMSKPAKHWEFRAKPAWQRLLVMIAGVLFNFLLAILIYAGIVFATGEKYVPIQNAKDGFIYSDMAHKAGFLDGDIPMKADGKSLEDHPGDARMALINAKEVEVLRNGETQKITIPGNFIFQLDEEAKNDTAAFSFMTYRIPAQFTQIIPGEAAAKAGLRTSDRVLAIDSTSVASVFDFMRVLKSNASRKVNVTVLRPQNPSAERISYVDADTLTVPVMLSAEGKMGVGLETNPAMFYDSKEKHYNIFQSVPRGIELGTSTLTNYVGSMKHVFSKEGAKSIGGFGSIGSIFPEKWNWIAFWNIAAFLSVALAFMNILPIPALDGGHVLFLIIEVITGRKPSQKVLEWSQMIGMGLLILLLLYANGMDIVRFFK